MDRPWSSSGSSSWPKTKPSSQRKKSVKRKASSLPTVPRLPSSTTHITHITPHTTLRGQTVTGRSKSAQRSTAHRPLGSVKSPSHRPSSATHTSQVYYSSSFECLVDNLESPSLRAPHSSPPAANTDNTSKTTDLYNPFKTWTRSRKVRDVFPFDKLPSDCKLKVFSYFSAQEKGRLASVCQDWSQLMKTVSLWKTVDFTQFSFQCLPRTRHISNEGGVQVCFQCHRKRVHKFAKHLLRLKPLITRLVFNYDIGDTSDGWLDILNQLLDGLPCRDLIYAQLKWKDTPMKPFSLESLPGRENTANVVYRHRQRHRLFVHLLNKFTTVAPNVETLVVPFGWSEKSMECLCRLQSLHSLVLEKYFVFQRLDQTLLNKLLAGLPQLQRLMLEVWTPSGRGLVKYTIQSPSLKYLDISQSRGFYLQDFNLPRLTQFFVARHPWNGPLISADQINLPCLYTTLTNGAPRLQKLNGHTLQADWRENLYPDLEDVLKAVCSCRQHKTSWAM